jgi:hypothetical protein
MEPSMKKLLSLFICILLWSAQAWSEQVACSEASTGGNALQTANTCGHAQQLVHLNALPLLSIDQQIFVTQAAPLLEKQALTTLDPQNKLSETQRQNLKPVIAADIRSELQQTWPAISRTALSSSLARRYVSLLTDSEMMTLLHFYRSGDGKSYLAFNRELDSLVAKGLAHMLGQTFSFNRQQQGSAAVRQQRQQLLAMSLPMRQLRAKQFQSGKQWDNQVTGLALDLLAAESGQELDRLVKRYNQHLAAFNTFQQTLAARHEVEAQVAWLTNLGSTPEVANQVSQRLPQLVVRWRHLARAPRNNPASGAQ